MRHPVHHPIEKQCDRVQAALRWSGNGSRPLGSIQMFKSVHAWENFPDGQKNRISTSIPAVMGYNDGIEQEQEQEHYRVRGQGLQRDVASVITWACHSRILFSWFSRVGGAVSHRIEDIGKGALPLASKCRSSATIRPAPLVSLCPHAHVGLCRLGCQLCACSSKQLFELGTLLTALLECLRMHGLSD